MSRVIVTLTDEERRALVALSASELRDPHDQARHILREELQRSGFLTLTDSRKQAQTLGRDEGARMSGNQSDRRPSGVASVTHMTQAQIEELRRRYEDIHGRPTDQVNFRRVPWLTGASSVKVERTMKIEIPGFAWVVLLVALAGPLMAWLGQYVPEPWGPLLIILLGAIVKAAQVLWPEQPAAAWEGPYSYALPKRKRNVWVRFLFG